MGVLVGPARDMGRGEGEAGVEEEHQAHQHQGPARVQFHHVNHWQGDHYYCIKHK